MVALVGPLAMIDGKLRQARKGATVTIDSCAGMWLIRVATQVFLTWLSNPSFILPIPPCFDVAVILFYASVSRFVYNGE